MVSRIGFGGIPITRLSLEEAVKVVRETIDRGINLIDTAYAYKHSEKMIGAAIKGLPREELIITTKTHALDKNSLMLELDESLRRLGTDYVDFYQIQNIRDKHRNEIFGPDGAYQGLQDAISAGKVRHPAFSCHSIDLAVEIMKEGHFDIVQLPLNFINTAAADKAVSLARELDMGFIAMKPFGGGMLSSARLVIRYLMQFDNVIADPGIETIEELMEIVALVEEGKTLDSDDLLEIEKLKNELSSTWCYRCDYCQPCPLDISISSILSVKSLLKRMPKESAEKRRNDIKQARLCRECRDCVLRCPYDLDIPQLIKENIAYWEERME